MNKADDRMKISVREFIAELEKKGSLNSSKSSAQYTNSMTLGTAIHIEIQKETLKTTEGYENEVPVRGTLVRNDIQFDITGRIDGLYKADGLHTIEEIKSCGNLHAFKTQLFADHEHPAVLQAKMYAYLYHLKTGIVPQLRLLLVSVFDKSERYTFEIPFSLQIFSAWVDDRCEKIFQMERERRVREQKRYALGTQLMFPFKNLRTGQSILIDRLNQHIEKGGRVLAQAPTGMGKTSGVLYPALKNALLNEKQVFYITPKNTQHTVAQEAVEHLRGTGQNVTSVTITSKEKSCLKEERICHPDHCEFAKNYYDKMNANSVAEKVLQEGVMDSAVFAKFGREFEICPFELSLDVSKYADVVICDYNYVFAPKAAIQRYFDDSEKAAKLILVIDEAHNLQIRAVDYYSPSVSSKTLAYLSDSVLQLNIPCVNSTGQDSHTRAAIIAKCRKKCATLIGKTSSLVMRHLKTNTLNQTYSVAPEKNEFYKLEKACSLVLATYLEHFPLMPPKDPLAEFFNLLTDFCTVLRLEGDEYIYTGTRYLDENILKITCCDASKNLRPRIAAFSSVVAFSATLKPFSFYAQLSGFEPGHFSTEEFQSPFPAENRKLLIIPQISTAFRDRNDSNYRKIADAISKIISLKKGNYFVFFPSFDFLENVSPLLSLSEFRICEQTKKMAPIDSQKIVKKLSQKTKNVVVLGVQGGIFAEGVDFPGDKLIGVIVVGPALPSFNYERERVRAYFDKHYGKGFDFAYTYPAMAKVIQAAGRVIRTETDKGLVVLMDKRFVQEDYVEVMPQDWLSGSVRSLVSRSILSDVTAFWDRHSDSSLKNLGFSNETSDGSN